MAEITVTKNVESLNVLFNKVKRIYFIATPTKLAELTTIDMELPVISDGVTFDTGAPNVTKVKLTTGVTWTSIAEAGDPNISFQIASIAGDINDTFMNKVSEQEVFLGGDSTAAAGKTIGGNAYKGSGFNLEPKKVIGSLLMLSEDGEAGIYMPKVEMYSSLVVENSKPAYYNVTTTPIAMDGAEGSIIPLHKTELK